MLRLFVAWPVPEELSREIGHMTGRLRAGLPAASWPHPESIHLTFAFLGDTPENRVAAISAALDTCAEARAIDVRAGGFGVFPDERRPRVAWIGLEPREPVTALANRVRASLRSAGVGFDEKPFRPHLTIARIKAPWRPSDVLTFREAFHGWASPLAALDRVDLYESRLGSGGAVHSVVHRIVLAK